MEHMYVSQNDELLVMINLRLRNRLVNDNITLP
jgi:hypothetical protein